MANKSLLFFYAKKFIYFWIRDKLFLVEICQLIVAVIEYLVFDFFLKHEGVKIYVAKGNVRKKSYTAGSVSAMTMVGKPKNFPVWGT